MENMYKGIIKSQGSKTLPKSNGGTYILMDVELLDGKAKGLTVAGTRTTLTKDSVVKSVPEIGTEVTVHHKMLPSTKELGKYAHFFEISVGGNTATNEELSNAFGV
jgi:hypothetical protein